MSVQFLRIEKESYSPLTLRDDVENWAKVDVIIPIVLLSKVSIFNYTSSISYLSREKPREKRENTVVENSDIK